MDCKAPRCWSAVLCTIVFFLCFSCAGGQKAVEPQVFDYDSIAVLPFQTVRPPTGQNVVRSPFSGATYLAGKITEGASVNMDQLLRERLESDPGMIFVGSELGRRLWREFDIGSGLDKESLAGFSKEIAESTGTDFALLGHLYAFEDKKGTAYGVEFPAYVAFNLTLLRLADSSVLWRGSFVRRQKDLSRNIFDVGEFVKAGGRWLTARQLAALGLDQVMEDFPIRKLR